MKLIIFLLLFIPVSVSATSSVLIDQNSTRILYCNNCHESSLIASTTKIMTAIIAIEYGDINSNVVVSEEVLKSYGSNIYIEVGEELKLIDLIYGLMLRSGNDAAMEIAINVTGDMESFVHLMNELAKDIGMDNTTFINSHGLENSEGVGNMSSAYDMALLMSYAMNNKTFREVTGSEDYIVKSSYKTYEWSNKNRLLYNYEYTTGGKTGFTDKAGRTLVTSATKDDKDLIVVTLDDYNDFDTHEYLYEKYFEEYQNILVLDHLNFVGVDDYYIKNSYELLVNDDELDKLNIEILMGSSKKEVLVKIDDEVIHREELYYKEEEEKSFWRKFLDFIIFW